MKKVTCERTGLFTSDEQQDNRLLTDEEILLVNGGGSEITIVVNGSETRVG